MCLLIYRPPNGIMTKNVLRKGYSNNSDGAGYAYSYKGKLYSEKGFFSFKKFWNAYRNIPKESPALIHFRISSEGRINKENCHPFLIDKNHAFCHNGSVQAKIGEKSEDFSDTYLFNEQILKPIFSDPNNIDKKFWLSPAFKWLMEECIGSFNKMSILDNRGNCVIFNECKGEWFSGCWFSNDSYKTDRKKTSGARIVTTLTQPLLNGGKKVTTTYSNGREITEYFPPATKNVNVNQKIGCCENENNGDIESIKEYESEFKRLIDAEEKIDIPNLF